MKKFLLTFTACLLAFSSLFAQAPEGFNYQGVARDANGDALVNTSVGVQFQLHQATAVGTVVYSETHSPTTNELGLFTVEVGNGTPGTGTFAAIDWRAGPYFLEVGLDPAGGSSYSSMGTQQLLSVPYALHAGSVDQADDGDWTISADTLSTDKWVAIGTTSPDTTLHLEGGFKYVDGNQGDAKLLTSDAAGNASWQELSSESIFGSGNIPEGDALCLSKLEELSSTLTYGTVAVSGDYAYMWGNSLQVVDISDPNSPVVVANGGVSGGQDVSLTVDGDYVYIVRSVYDTPGAEFKLDVVNVSDPANPSPSGSLILANARAVDIDKAGDYIYALGRDDSSLLLEGLLKVVNVSDPTNPSLTGSLDVGPSPRSLAVDGIHVFIGTGEYFDFPNPIEQQGELKVIDISSPSVPTLIGTFDNLTRGADQIAVSGNNVYVVDNAGLDLLVIDISVPSTPTQVGQIIGVAPLLTFFGGIVVSGDYAFVNGDRDLVGIDISDPTNPFVAGSVGLVGPTGSLNGLGVQGDYAYTADLPGDRLFVVELFCPNILTIDPGTGTFSSQPLTGEVGAQGPPGPQGIQGPIGATGPTGVSVSNAAITNDELVLTLSDASTINAGNVVGPQGPQGVQGPIGGVANVNGTENYLGKFSATGDSIGNSDIINVGGKVGIGIANPGRKLHVAINGGSSGLQVTTATSGSTASDGLVVGMNETAGDQAYVLNQENTELVFGTNATERLRIDAAGKVGIGTANPVRKLEVNGDAYISDKLFVDDVGLHVASPSGSNNLVLQGVDNAEWTFTTAGTSAPARINFDAIGTFTAFFDGNIEYVGSLLDVSDKRLKENLLEVENASTRLQALKAYTYNMKEDSAKTREYGLMAQDVIKVFPEMVKTIDEDNGYMGVSYIQLIPVLVEALKEQRTENEEQQKLIDQQRQTIDELLLQLDTNTDLLTELQKYLSVQGKK